ncbi:SIR2 family NAD-dependent protein deacylase [Psychroflexus planctonicus]|uniref:NAD-dependent protein deacylase n=1 Tax=Psychroflexus planctonicus TaxID=1526575 RepID=A0ABQ1SJL0_9FLAO|nr:NAD-dependent deacylase [Psychroflexus planctonicus]GGE43247.1 NAD-dependent protein deacylase [Psychroflexus planctonicus]
MKIAVLTGAGISAESGIKTFRDNDGLWEGHDVMEVASPQGWKKNPSNVLQFYNLRRKQLLEVKPNAAHFALTELQARFDVQIVTQNVDNLHEKAGNKNVLHLHGELLKARSEHNDNLVYPWEKDINLGDKAKDGNQLRPDIVWFGEAVPKIEEATKIFSEANIVIVIGTSLQVYPAAGLIDFAPVDAEIYLIDPNPNVEASKNLHVFAEKAAKATPRIVKKIISTHA